MGEANDAEAAMTAAATVAERFLEEAVEAAGDPVGDAVPLAMLELCVTVLVDQFGHDDTISLLRDLADQIAADPDRGQEDG